MPPWLDFGLIATLALLVLWLVPKFQTSRFNIDPAVRFDKENEARKTLATAMGGLVIVVTLYSTWGTLRATQEGQITDRYTKAIEELGATDASGPKYDVRLGGIYALDRIARDSPRDRHTIDNVLCAYVRHASQVTPSNEPKRDRTDQQAVLRILGSRGSRQGERADEVLNLSGVVLDKIRFTDGNYEKTDFTSARIVESDFTRSRLAQVSFDDADLTASSFHNADLSSSDLRGSILDDADLVAANLSRARLQRASFARTKMKGADLTGANLEDAHFEGVDLTGVLGLCREQVAHINRDARTRLPDVKTCPQ